MTKGVGGSTAAIELAKLTEQRDQAVAIGFDEYRQAVCGDAGNRHHRPLSRCHHQFAITPSSIIQTNTGRPIL